MHYEPCFPKSYSNMTWEKMSHNKNQMLTKKILKWDQRKRFGLSTNLNHFTRTVRIFQNSVEHGQNVSNFDRAQLKHTSGSVKNTSSKKVETYLNLVVIVKMYRILMLRRVKHMLLGRARSRTFIFCRDGEKKSEYDLDGRNILSLSGYGQNLPLFGRVNILLSSYQKSYHGGDGGMGGWGMGDGEDGGREVRSCRRTIEFLHSV